MPSSTKYRFVMNGKMVYIDYTAGDLDLIKTARKSPDFNMQQSTGLKDKNGKEIYEGDKLLTGPITIREVVFKNGAFVGKDIIGIYAEENNRYNRLLPSNCEVIGNIYENPELVK